MQLYLLSAVGLSQGRAAAECLPHTGMSFYWDKAFIREHV